ncbi:DUF1330 domain-containing protein [Paracoccus sp. 11-3]|uniref:DUF1330 domain-containing protein n=2 Tax=Paracoccus amoyensis TaxID=2760093 RepID=A0A926GEL9_9RHOB|nr:DUF1330 domain-containing protein [Paracoccus amoyensis]MBC9247126.1 DUF1330 domain-containing protein [Paracoccus amoyensis]
MPKGYRVAHVDVDDPAASEAYRTANAAAFYDSPEYRSAKALRDPVTVGDITTVEG